MKLLKALAFILAWTVKILGMCGICIAICFISPILIGGWAMDKTFGENGW